MILGRVIGNLVATAKHPSYAGRTLLIVAPEDPHGLPAGDEIVAVDGVGAGIGERVLVVLEGRSAAEVMRVPQATVDAAVIGIVDRVDLLPAERP